MSMRDPRLNVIAPVCLALAALTLSLLPAPLVAQTAATQTARLDSVWLLPERSAPAQVIARNESRLTAEVSGAVVRWSADTGAAVRRGDVLVQIDATDAQLALLRAEATRDAARARLELGEAQRQRARELVAQGFFSQEALAQRETEVTLQRAEVAAAEAQVQTARRQIDKAVVRAPFAGTVTQRTVQLGEVVTPGTPLMVVSETGAVEVQASVAPTELAGLRGATTLHFQAQGSESRSVIRVVRVVGAVQSGSRTQTVRLGFAEPTALPAGSAGRILWNDPQPHVPASLIVRRGGQLGVFIRTDGSARFVPLDGAQEGRATPTSLPPDTQVVIRGQAALTDGQPLN